MSTYRERWNQASGDNDRKAAVPPEFRQEFPSLAEVLGGIEVAKGEQGGVPPATINLWFEGGELHFCIMPRLGNRVAFGVVQDPCKGLAGIEVEVCQGRFGWKPSKNRRTA